MFSKTCLGLCESTRIDKLHYPSVALVPQEIVISGLAVRPHQTFLAYQGNPFEAVDLVLSAPTSVMSPLPFFLVFPRSPLHPGPGHFITDENDSGKRDETCRTFLDITVMRAPSTPNEFHLLPIRFLTSTSSHCHQFRRGVDRISRVFIWGDVVGRWRSLETSKGGIGAIFELHVDGTVDFSSEAPFESPYRIDGNQLILLQRLTAIRSRKRQLHFSAVNFLSGKVLLSLSSLERVPAFIPLTPSSESGLALGI
ncbi:MAG: hypothetical protein ACJ74Z_02830 [Bryobacteraceae bacterium]